MLNNNQVLLNQPSGQSTISTTQQSVPTEGPDTIMGSAGDDVIDALGGDDAVYGGAGSDAISGGEGNDVLCADVYPGSQSTTVSDSGLDAPDAWNHCSVGPAMTSWSGPTAWTTCMAASATTYSRVSRCNDASHVIGFRDEEGPIWESDHGARAAATCGW